MAERIYSVYNGAAPGAAAQVGVASGTAIKTMIQLAVPSTAQITIIEWGISFTGSAAAVPVECELMSAATTAQTVTPYTNGDVIKFNNIASQIFSAITLGTASSGFSSTSEGATPTSVRMFDAQYVAPTGQYVKQWPLGREPVAEASTNVRLRVTAPATVTTLCYVTWAE